MEKLRRLIARLLMVLAVLIPLAAVGMYWINPLGAKSYDPRQRIIGYAPYRIPSRSMEPTLVPGQVVILRAGYYRKRKPERGDLVVFRNAEDGNPWIQRVIGLPGETVAIEEGVLLIDGSAVSEDYVEPADKVGVYSWEMAEEEIPEGEYFLMGDNRDNSYDGRMMGPVPLDAFMGKVVAVMKLLGPGSQ